MKVFTHICLFVLLLGTTTQAQTAKDNNSLAKVPVKQPVKHVVLKKPKPLHTELSFGLRLNTDGWGIFVDKGWVKSEDRYRDFFYDVKLLQVELDEKKVPAEIKRSNTSSSYNNEKPKPFIYGKINNFYTFKIGYGGRKMLAGKPEPGAISMHFVYVGGLSLGLLKPYYLSVSAPTTEPDITYSDSTKQYFLDKRYILGSSGFGKGLGETKIIPGVHLKAAMHFDFAANKARVLALETGVNFEIYSKAIEIMANKDAKAYFLNAYLSLQFGKRW